MKSFKTSVLWIVFLFGFLFLSLKQTQAAQDTYSQKLSQSLVELKEKVDQLSVANQGLGLKNEQMKASFKEYQLTLGKLIQENQQLEDAKAKLQKTSAGKAKQIDQLNAMSVSLDQHMASLSGQLKAFQEGIVSKQKESGRLNQQIEGYSKPISSIASDDMSPDLVKVLEQKQKEKLATLKMISESQEHQLLLQEQILDYKKNFPAPNMSTPTNKGGNKALLEAQVFQFQDEIVQLNVSFKDSGQGWSENQIHELERSVNDLEKNRNELKVLVKKMHQKAQNIAPSQDQAIERGKLQANISQLKLEAKNLKIDLAELQQQMVDLDKRKSYLEAFLR